MNKFKVMKTHTMEQLSDEWFEIRKGKMTASHAQAIGSCGKGLDTYIYEIMSNYFAQTQEEQYTNGDMERGIELEEQAREMYMMETGDWVKKVGFIETDKYTGCSPDGLIDKDGGIEIKCHGNLKHFKFILYGEKEIESAYIWQIQMNMFLTNRKWFDFVAYNPNFEKNILMFRIKPDKKKQEKILEGLDIGAKKIKEITKLWKIGN